jgi:methyl-accepting chemotaxis protein
VKVPRERKLRKYAGNRDDKVLEDWVEDAKRAVAAQKLTGADAVDYLYHNLEGAARDEIRLRQADEWSTPDLMYQVLRDTFGEKLTLTQLLQRYYGRRQKERESIQDYSHALMALLDQLEKTHPDSVANRNQMLRDAFVENLRDTQLRRDLRRMLRESPDKTFQAIRDEAMRTLEEDRPVPRTAHTREVETEPLECQQVSSLPPKAMQDLMAGQKLLANGLQQQQKILAETQAALASLTQRVQEKGVRRCYNCGQPDHLSYDCPRLSQKGTWRPRRRNEEREDEQKRSEKESSNSRTPRQ